MGCQWGKHLGRLSGVTRSDGGDGECEAWGTGEKSNEEVQFFLCKREKLAKEEKKNENEKNRKEKMKGKKKKKKLFPSRFDFAMKIVNNWEERGKKHTL